MGVESCLRALEFVKKKIQENLSNNLPIGVYEWLKYEVEDECILPEDIPQDLRLGALRIYENLTRVGELERVYSNYIDTLIAWKFPGLVRDIKNEANVVLRGTIRLINDEFEENQEIAKKILGK